MTGPHPDAERFTASDGQRLGFRLVGTGAPVVCVPGGPGRAASYLGDLGGLDRHRRLVLADPRGSGTSRPADPAGLTLDRLVGDLDELRRHLGLDAPVLLGHSFGCRVIAGYLERGLPARAALLLTPPPLGEDELVAAGRRRILQARSGDPALADALAAAGELPGARPADQRMLERMTVPLWYGRWDDAAGEHAARAAAEVSARTALMLRDSARAAPPPRPELLDVPCLVVAGELDFLSPPDALHALHQRLPRGRYALIPGAGHYPWLDDPELHTAALVDFLAGAGVG